MQYSEDVRMWLLALWQRWAYKRFKRKKSLESSSFKRQSAPRISFVWAADWRLFFSISIARRARWCCRTFCFRVAPNKEQRISRFDEWLLCSSPAPSFLHFLCKLGWSFLFALYLLHLMSPCSPDGRWGAPRFHTEQHWKMFRVTAGVFGQLNQVAA